MTQTTPTTPDKSAPEKAMDDPLLLQIMALFDKMEVENKYTEREKITWQAYKIVLQLNEELKKLRTPAQETGQQDAEALIKRLDRIWDNLQPYPECPSYEDQDLSEQLDNDYEAIKAALLRAPSSPREGVEELKRQVEQYLTDMENSETPERLACGLRDTYSKYRTGAVTAVQWLADRGYLTSQTSAPDAKESK